MANIFQDHQKTVYLLFIINPIHTLYTSNISCNMMQTIINSRACVYFWMVNKVLLMSVFRFLNVERSMMSSVFGRGLWKFLQFSFFWKRTCNCRAIEWKKNMLPLLSSPTSSSFVVVADVAHSIWRRHFTSFKFIITFAQ